MSAPTAAKTENGMKVLAAWLPVITAIVGLFYAAAGYYVLLLPKISQLMPGGEYDLSGVRERIVQDEAFIADAEKALKGYVGLSAENRRRAAKLIPLNDPDIPGLLVQLDAIAQENNMRLKGVDAVVSEKIITALGRKPIRITASFEGGNYEQYKLLLRDLEDSLRIFDVQATTVDRGSSAFNMTMLAYFLDKPGAAKAAAKQ